MLVHLLERRLSKYVERLELELAHMGETDRTRHGVNREHLQAELGLMRDLAARIDAWSVERSREVIERMDRWEDE